MIVIRDGSAEEFVARHTADEADDLDRVVDHDPAGPEAMPRLVELGGEDPVLIEVTRLDGQVGRFERTAALLVDDIEGTDQAHVIAEVGDVAWASAAVEVRHEGRPADRAEDEVRATEHDIPLRVPRAEREQGGREGNQLLDLSRVHPDRAGLTVHGRARAAQQIDRAIAEHLHPDLRKDPQRRGVDRLDLVG